MPSCMEVRQHLLYSVQLEPPVICSVCMDESIFKIESLPPTTAASKQHAMRAYLQVQQWLENYLSDSKSVWETKGHTLNRTSTNQPAAPQTLLHLVSCGCKLGCGRACSCRKAGMVCSDICTPCMGVTCSNTVPSSSDVEHDTE